MKDNVKWEKIDCPVCGGNNFTLLFKKKGEPFVRCNSCTLMLINPRPVYEHVVQTYTEDYSGFYIGKENKKIKRFTRWAREAQRLAPKTGRWLDVGCSAGYVVKVARDLGYEAHGVDVEGHGIRYAREHLGLDNLSHGMLEEQGYSDGYFDVISMYDVIEHVPDLNAFVAELVRILSPQGIIDIRTPDEGHWRRPKNIEQWDALIPSEHLYYFNRKTIKQLFEKHGLRIVKFGFNFKPTLKIYASHK